MKIEILDKVEEEDYILHLRTIRISDSGEKDATYVDSEIFSDLSKFMPSDLQGDQAFYEEVSSLHSNSELEFLLIWMTSIAAYPFQDEEAMVRNYERDKIFNTLIKVGIIELRGKE